MDWRLRLHIYRVSRTYGLLRRLSKWADKHYNDYAWKMDDLITKYGRPYDRNKKRTFWTKLFEV